MSKFLPIAVAKTRAVSQIACIKDNDAVINNVLDIPKVSVFLERERFLYRYLTYSFHF
jgi:hypothetical protein